MAEKGLLCCLALYCEAPADGVVPGSGLSMNAKIIAHKGVPQAEAKRTCFRFNGEIQEEQASCTQTYIMHLAVTVTLFAMGFSIIKKLNTAKVTT